MALEFQASAAQPRSSFNAKTHPQTKPAQDICARVADGASRKPPTMSLHERASGARTKRDRLLWSRGGAAQRDDERPTTRCLEIAKDPKYGRPNSSGKTRCGTHGSAGRSLRPSGQKAEAILRRRLTLMLEASVEPGFW